MSDEDGSELDDYDLETPTTNNGLSYPKKISRNIHSVHAATLVGNLRVDAMKKSGQFSAIDYTAMMRKTGYTCGNCTEMAAVAADIFDGKQIEEDITLISCDTAGDHVVCAVGKIAKVKSLTRFDQFCDSNPSLVIVDPWANITCLADNYEYKLQKKAAKWALAGKRIYSSHGWIVPDGNYVRSIMRSGFSYYDARVDCPRPEEGL